MNRDTLPSGADVAMATGERMVRARRTITAYPSAGPALSVTLVRDVVAEIWGKVMPEAVRDVMVTAAALAVELGVTTVPEEAGDQAAATMLKMTAEWAAAGKPLIGSAMPPARAFASSVAFDRDEDAETLTTLATLLALMHIPGPEYEL